MSRAFLGGVEVGAGARGDTDTLTAGLPLSRSRPRPLATLVTPTTSTPVQDNISLIFPLVFHLASTHLGRGTQQQIHWLVDGPRGSETPTVGALGRGSLRAKQQDPVKALDGKFLVAPLAGRRDNPVQKS